MESVFKTAGWVIFICILFAWFCGNDNGSATLEDGVGCGLSKLNHN